MKRGKPLKRGGSLRRGRPLRARSEQAEAAQTERRRNMREHFGHGPVPCAGAGILPTCPGHRAGREHRADAPHEPGKRSQGADPTDPGQAIALCFDGHRWVHDHPAQASQMRTAAGQPFLTLDSPD